MLSIAERHKYILEKLEKFGFIRITDVAEELGVTKVTIRKDVKILEGKGLLYKEKEMDPNNIMNPGKMGFKGM